MMLVTKDVLMLLNNVLMPRTRESIPTAESVAMLATTGAYSTRS